MTRYQKHIILSEIGSEGQDKLSKAKVLVVGAGGLGCPILQYLAAAGVGTIGIIDFDTVEESNLQRQILYGSSSLGKNKALAAKDRLADLNPTITINGYPEKLTYGNVLSLFGKYDIIVDGTDNYKTRYLINDACVIAKKPLVYGAIHKFEGQIAVFNHQGSATYRCLFPETSKLRGLNCAEIGVLGVLAGIIGTKQANEVLKLILGIGTPLSGKLWLYNALSEEVTIIKIKRSEASIEKALKKAQYFEAHINGVKCTNTAHEISFEEAIQNPNTLFVDVRKPDEEPKVNSSLNSINIPLHELKHNLSTIALGKDIVFFCQSGERSLQAVSIFKKHYKTPCYSLKGGALHIIQNYIPINN